MDLTSLYGRAEGECKRWQSSIDCSLNIASSFVLHAGRETTPVSSEPTDSGFDKMAIAFLRVTDHGQSKLEKSIRSKHPLAVRSAFRQNTEKAKSVLEYFSLILLDCFVKRDMRQRSVNLLRSLSSGGLG